VTLSRETSPLLFPNILPVKEFKGIKRKAEQVEIAKIGEV